MKDIISPIVARLIGSDEKKLENHKLIILGMHFDIGSFILSLFNFWLILVIVFYLVRALPKETVSKK
jgi:large-conductance mechanosensitive channel